MIRHEFKLLRSKGSIIVASVFVSEKLKMKSAGAKLEFESMTEPQKGVEMRLGFVYKDINVHRCFYQPYITDKLLVAPLLVCQLVLGWMLQTLLIPYQRGYSPTCQA